MWMKFADYVTHGACRFLVFGSRAKAEFAHRINDTALYRFQAVT